MPVSGDGMLLKASRPTLKAGSAGELDGGTAPDVGRVRRTAHRHQGPARPWAPATWRHGDSSTLRPTPPRSSRRIRHRPRTAAPLSQRATTGGPWCTTSTPPGVRSTLPDAGQAHHHHRVRPVRQRRPGAVRSQPRAGARERPTPTRPSWPTSASPAYRRRSEPSCCPTAASTTLTAPVRWRPSARCTGSVLDAELKDGTATVLAAGDQAIVRHRTVNEYDNGRPTDGTATVSDKVTKRTEGGQPRNWPTLTADVRGHPDRVRLGQGRAHQHYPGPGRPGHHREDRLRRPGPAITRSPARPRPGPTPAR